MQIKSIGEAQHAYAKMILIAPKAVVHTWGAANIKLNHWNLHASNPASTNHYSSLQSHTLAQLITNLLTEKKSYLLWADSLLRRRSGSGYATLGSQVLRSPLQSWTCHAFQTILVLQSGSLYYIYTSNHFLRNQEFLSNTPMDLTRLLKEGRHKGKPSGYKEATIERTHKTW